MFDKSTHFQQVCQLLLSLIVGRDQSKKLFRTLQDTLKMQAVAPCLSLS